MKIIIIFILNIVYNKIIIYYLNKNQNTTIIKDKNLKILYYLSNSILNKNYFRFESNYLTKLLVLLHLINYN